jgi:hypothetical protein
MRKTFGGKWISFMGIPPLIFLFIPLMLLQVLIQRIKVNRRRRKLQNEDVNEAFVGSWF